MHNIFMKIKVIYIFGYIYEFADISLFSFIFYLWRTYSFIRKKILYGTGNVRMHYSFFLKLKTFIFMVKNRAFAGPSLYLPLFLDIWKTCTFKREKIPNKNFIDTTHKSSWWFLRGWPDVVSLGCHANPVQWFFLWIMIRVLYMSTSKGTYMYLFLLIDLVAY